MTTQTIEVEGLPVGWRAVAYRVPCLGEHVIWGRRVSEWGRGNGDDQHLIVEKIKPREIRLVETDEVRQVGSGDWYELDGKVLSWMSHSKSADLFKIWKEVKETDLPLNSDEPKLELNLAECKALFTGNFALVSKVKKFIKENS